MQELQYDTTPLEFNAKAEHILASYCRKNQEYRRIVVRIGQNRCPSIRDSCVGASVTLECMQAPSYKKECLKP